MFILNGFDVVRIGLKWFKTVRNDSQWSRDQGNANTYRLTMRTHAWGGNKSVLLATPPGPGPPRGGGAGAHGSQTAVPAHPVCLAPPPGSDWFKLAQTGQI